MFASEYGWSKNDIFFDMYPEDVIMLQPYIQSRKAEDYLVLTRIASQPYMKEDAQQTFINSLMSKTRGGQSIDTSQLDRKGLDALRKALKGEKNSKIKVK